MLLLIKPDQPEAEPGPRILRLAAQHVVEEPLGIFHVLLLNGVGAGDGARVQVLGIARQHLLGELARPRHVAVVHLEQREIGLALVVLSFPQPPVAEFDRLLHLAQMMQAARQIREVVARLEAERQGAIEILLRLAPLVLIELSEAQVIEQRRTVPVFAQKTGEDSFGLGKAVLGDAHRSDAASRRRVLRRFGEAALERRDRLLESGRALIEIAEREPQQGVMRVGLDVGLVLGDGKLERDGRGIWHHRKISAPWTVEAYSVLPGFARTDARVSKPARRTW